MAKYKVFRSDGKQGGLIAENHYEALKKSIPANMEVTEVYTRNEANVIVQGQKVTKFYRVGKKSTVGKEKGILLYDISWCVPEENMDDGNLPELPSVVYIANPTAEQIESAKDGDEEEVLVNYLSDKYGWLVEAFRIDFVAPNDPRLKRKSLTKNNKTRKFEFYTEGNPECAIICDGTMIYGKDIDMYYMRVRDNAEDEAKKAIKEIELYVKNGVRQEQEEVDTYYNPILFTLTSAEKKKIYDVYRDGLIDYYELTDDPDDSLASQYEEEDI